MVQIIASHYMYTTFSEEEKFKKIEKNIIKIILYSCQLFDFCYPFIIELIGICSKKIGGLIINKINENENNALPGIVNHSHVDLFP